MLRTFETEEELYKKFKAMCDREGKKIGEKINELIENEVKIHDNGNPIHKLDNWQDSKFKAFPAFMRNRNDWQNYIENHTNEKELQEILNQASTIHSLADKKIQYGTTNVIKY